MVRELPSALRRLKPTVHPKGSTVLVLQGLESIVGIEMHEGDYTDTATTSFFFATSFGGIEGASFSQSSNSRR